jgi:hypothetical protein
MKGAPLDTARAADDGLRKLSAGKVDLHGRGRIQGPRQIARADGAAHRLVTELDANFGAIAIDEVCGLLPTDQGHVVTCHQQLCRQQ